MRGRWSGWEETKQDLGQELELLGQKQQPHSGLERRSRDILSEALYLKTFSPTDEAAC